MTAGVGRADRQRAICGFGGQIPQQASVGRLAGFPRSWHADSSVENDEGTGRWLLSNTDADGSERPDQSTRTDGNTLDHANLQSVVRVRYELT